MPDSAVRRRYRFPAMPAAGVSPSRISHPEPGRSLGATVTRIDPPIREAVRLLETAKVPAVLSSLVFDSTVYGPGCNRESVELRLAWFLVNVALAHAFLTRRPTISPLKDALEWFIADEGVTCTILDCFSREQIQSAERALSQLEISGDVLELFPYVIEPHGHISRNKRETCEIARQTRSTKRNSGVYYTPSDVAEFMVNEVALKSSENDTWLDPACGTGVFLRSILRQSSSENTNRDLLGYVTRCLHGIDRSALATDQAAFVLLVECALHGQLAQPFVDAWKTIKGKLICMDALRLIPERRDNALDEDGLHLVSIKDIFSDIGENGFTHVVMNPPYAPAVVDRGLKLLWHCLSDVPEGQYANIHLAFAEMLWRLTSRDGASAAVLPLSIGSNTLKPFQRLRNELIKNGGVSKFLFFDREPQALFGEDIKTRNVILMYEKHDEDSCSVLTSRLLKWTGEQRSSIFTCSRLVPVSASQCQAFIPKLGSKEEVFLYTSLTRPELAIKRLPFVPPFTRISLSSAIQSEPALRRRTVLVSATAYNFMNCFFADALPNNPPYPYSSSPVSAIMLDSEEDAYAAFALLASRISFWMWHVEGDGFHVTAEYLRRLPLWGALGSISVRSQLEVLGRQLWNCGVNNMVGSVNGGRQTYSFYCGHSHPMIRAVERIVLDHFGIDNHLSRCLDAFVSSVVSIDGTRRERVFDWKLKHCA